MSIFANPERFWILPAALPLAAWLAYHSWRRPTDWAALGQSGRPLGDGAWPWLLAMILLVVALAQPRWGRVLGEKGAEGHDVVFLVDASRSMAAEDAVPDRMTLAIEGATSLLGQLGREPGDRAGVVAFAGRGVIRCPLTENLEAAADAIRSIRPGEVEPGGTDLGAGLETALNAFDLEEHVDGRTIVVFSDGEDHVGSWPGLIERLRAARIIVHSVAIGDRDQAHPVPSQPANSTRRSDLVFEALAKATGGVLIPIGLTSVDLGSLYRDRIEPLARRRRDALRPPERVERFPSFILAALVVGLVGSWPGLSRRKARRLAFVALAITLPSMGAGDEPSRRPSDLIADGRNAYKAGRYVEALEAFERAAKLAPDAAIPRYDAAAALFQIGRLPEAIARYEEAREHADASLAIKIDYALGNAYLRLGEISSAITHYDACIASTHPGTESQSVRDDARLNRSFALSRNPPKAPQTDPSQPARNPPDRPRKPPGPGEGGSEPSPTNGPSDPGGEGNGSRGAGGAGGSGQPPPELKSPRARLDEILNDVKEASKQRPANPLSKSGGGSGKDW